MVLQRLRNQFYNSLLFLATHEGINASGKNEIYGCIFGRDSAITILKILRTHKKQPDSLLLAIVRRSLLTLISLQGKEINIESGEEPGKYIHEFRKEKFDHLVVNRARPWFVYCDGKLRNYDSIDSTPLTLIALYKYWQITNDNEFLLKALPSIEAGLNWIITYGDIDKDILIEYEFPINRKSGGLVVQSWTDSKDSLIQFDGSFPAYPIAPVEAQGYAWLAMKVWSDFYKNYSFSFSNRLSAQAHALKKRFNELFMYKDNNLTYAIQALDGYKRQIKTITANPLLCLWAAYHGDTQTECIIDDIFIHDLITRAFQPDLFVEDAGIRTMSTLSPTYNSGKNSYHNGSFWPMLNGLIIEGLENFGYYHQASLLKQASILPLLYFGSPVELYIKTQNAYELYCSANGQVSCKEQAWSAAAALDWLT